MINYTTINHIARERFSLTWVEYGLIDLIHNLSNSPESENRWCFASKEKLAEFLGISKRYVHKIINVAIEKGLIEKHPSTKHLRTTQLWFDIAIIKDSKQSLLPVNEEGIPSSYMNKVHSEQSSYNKDIYINTPVFNKLNTGQVVKKQPTCPLLNGSPLKEKYPNGHAECVEWKLACEKYRNRRFIDDGRAFLEIHKALKKGHDFDCLNDCLHQADDRYGKGSWTIRTLLEFAERGACGRNHRGA